MMVMRKKLHNNLVQINKRCMEYIFIMQVGKGMRGGMSVLSEGGRTGAGAVCSTESTPLAGAEAVRSFEGFQTPAE